MKTGKLQLIKVLLKGLLFLNASILMGQDLAWKGQTQIKPDLFVEGSNRLRTQSMKVDSEGSIYILGDVFSGSKEIDIDFGPGKSLLAGNAGSSSNPYIIKYAKNGDLLWYRVFEGGAQDFRGKLVLDNNDNIYIAGTYKITPGFSFPFDLDPSAGTKLFDPIYSSINEQAFFIEKLDKDGNFLWGEGIDGSGNEEFQDFKLDRNNSLVLGITLTGAINFDPLGVAPITTSPYFPNASGYIVKYNLNGALLSVNELISNSSVNISSFEFDAQNNLYVSGTYQGDCDFDITAGTTIKTAASERGFSVKYLNTTNTIDWIYEHDYAIREIKYNAANSSIAYIGYFSGTLDVDNTNGTLNLTSNGGKDIVVLNYNLNGAFLNGFNIGGSNDDLGFVINTDNIGNLYIGGTCEGVIDSDPTSQIKLIGNNAVVNPFDPTPIVPYYRSCFIIKFDNGNNHKWAKSLMDTTSAMYYPYPIGGMGIEVDAKRNIYTLCNGRYIADYLEDFFVYKFTQDPSLVWPGDANDDLIANNTDLLAIGLAYGSTGAARANNTIDWVGKTATPWGTTLPNGADYNNADCNGDGVINADDTTAILQNYNQIHTLKLAPNIAGANDPTLLVDFPAGNYSNGAIINVPIKLGNSTIPANNAYGLAFTLDYPTTGFDANSVKVKFNNSWMGTYNTDFIGLQKNFPINKQIDVALTRINKTNITGNGIICEISIIVDNLGGITALKLANIVEQFSLSKASLIDKDGVLIPINLQGDSVQIISSINDVNLEKSIAVYPNPATDNVVITSANTIKSVVINDIAGKQVYAVAGTFANLTVNLSTVNSGIYFATIQTEEGVIRKKITVKH